MTETPLSPEERRTRLNQAVTRAIRAGWRIESQSDFQAIVVSGRRVNHVLHLLLSILLIGLWLIVWLILAITGGEKRWLIEVSETGVVSRYKLP